MQRHERVLQQMKRRFSAWTPWLQSATRATIKLIATGQSNAFVVVAEWPGGEHKKVYDVAYVLAHGRVGCVKDYARAFIREVLEKRGVIDGSSS